ncbi:hypothetical protein DV738_g4996, partial [Chaetothyriales sp. CBS 135597]
MAWQPREDELGQLVECLKNSLTGHDRNKQKEAEIVRLTAILNQARQNPYFVDYLVYIFSTPQIGDHFQLNPGTLFLVRYAAAIKLKNHIKDAYSSIPKEKLVQVKAGTLQMLQEPNAQLRAFAGTIITEIVQQGGLLSWPEVLQDLITLVANGPGNVSDDTQEGAMSALAKVCEDNKRLLDKEYQGQKPMSVIVPQLLDFATHPNPKIRVFALGTLKAFIPLKSKVLLDRLGFYMQKTFDRASDPDVQVRRVVCQSIVQLVESKPEVLPPHMEGLVQYILAQQQQSGNPDLALDAAEFWLSVGEQDELKGLMGPYLNQIIPVLLAGIVYGEEDVFRLGGDDADAEEEDRPEDIKPQFAATKTGRGAAAEPKDGEAPNGEPNGQAPNPSQKAELSDGEVEESDLDSDDDWDDEDPENVWSLRKCSAAALDIFAVNYHATVFNIILPYLKENLSHQLWPRREAAVLALGAIADGCMDVVSPHLPELIPYLITLLRDEEPVVRQITCWCLARYSEWAAQLSDPAQKQQFFVPMMEGLLHRMLDSNKKVQEAGASSFASLEEKSRENLKPYVEPILRQFTQCFQRYKDKNMYILYDCLQELADSVGQEMAKPELVDMLMPVLIARWNKIPDDAREMFPLLGCLGYLAGAYGDTFSQFAPPIFARCIKLIFSTLQQNMSFLSGEAVDSPDKDFIVTALDLVSAIIQAIPPEKSSPLVQSSQPNFFDLLSFCMEDSTPDVRQSAYALLGDCAIAIYSVLAPALPKIMPILIKHIDLDLIRDDDSDSGFNVLINVCWSVGEIGARTSAETLSPYLESLYRNLLSVVTNEEVPDAANENACMTLGRLGLSCPDLLAPHLSEYAGAFLNSISKTSTSDEKASAFLGFNAVVERNPQAMEAVLADYFTAVAGWPIKGKLAADYANVRQSFANILQGYKGLLGDQWSGFIGRLPANVRNKIAEGYGAQ